MKFETFNLILWIIESENVWPKAMLARIKYTLQFLLFIFQPDNSSSQRWSIMEKWKWKWKWNSSFAHGWYTYLNIYKLCSLFGWLFALRAPNTLHVHVFESMKHFGKLFFCWNVSVYGAIVWNMATSWRRQEKQNFRNFLLFFLSRQIFSEMRLLFSVAFF